MKNSYEKRCFVIQIFRFVSENRNKSRTCTYTHIRKRALVLRIYFLFHIRECKCLVRIRKVFLAHNVFPFTVFFRTFILCSELFLKEGAKNPESRKQITRRILLQIKCRARQKFFFCFLALRTLLLLFCIGKFVRNTSSFLSKRVYLDIYIAFDFDEKIYTSNAPHFAIN